MQSGRRTCDECRKNYDKNDPKLMLHELTVFP